jgi:hypothetical protein
MNRSLVLPDLRGLITEGRSDVPREGGCGTRYLQCSQTPNDYKDYEKWQTTTGS